MKTKTAEQAIRELELQPLPGEGGFFRETYRSKQTVKVTFSGSTTPVERSLNTQIYYLVTESSYSALHRLKQDEIYHFYDGLPAEIFLIFEDYLTKIGRKSELINLFLTAISVDYLALQQMGNWADLKVALHYGKVLGSRAKEAVAKAEKPKLSVVRGEVV